MVISFSKKSNGRKKNIRLGANRSSGLTLSVLGLRYLWDTYVECPVGKWRNKFSKGLSLRNLDSKAPQAKTVAFEAQHEYGNDYQKSCFHWCLWKRSYRVKGPNS